jgi:hypothetical protein
MFISNREFKKNDRAPEQHIKILAGAPRCTKKHSYKSGLFFKKNYPLSACRWWFLADTYFPTGLDPGAAATTLSASTISGRISAGMPMTISLLSIPENFRDPSHPSEMFIFPLR